MPKKPTVRELEKRVGDWEEHAFNSWHYVENGTGKILGDVDRQYHYWSATCRKYPTPYEYLGDFTTERAAKWAVERACTAAREAAIAENAAPQAPSAGIHSGEDLPVGATPPTPMTQPQWLTSLIIQVKERVEDDATSKCCLTLQHAAAAIRDFQQLERELIRLHEGRKA